MKTFPIFIMYQHPLKYSEEGTPTTEVIKIDCIETDVSDQSYFKINESDDIYYIHRVRQIYSKKERKFVKNFAFDETMIMEEDKFQFQFQFLKAKKYKNTIII